METEIPQKLRAQVLFEAGHRTPKSLERRGGIPERTARRYIAEFNEGGDWTRKEYTPRLKRKQSPRIIKKVIVKAVQRTKAYSSRGIGHDVGASHTHVQTILKNAGLSYKKVNKRVLINADTKAARLAYAEEMLERESDWGYVSFTDECSVWLSKSQPS